MSSGSPESAKKLKEQDSPQANPPLFWLAGLAIGVGIQLLTVLTEPPAGMSITAWRCSGLAMMMAIFWSVEILPTAITALLPLVLSPILDLTTIDKAAAPYAHPVIFLFMGGFVLGLAMERWNLHNRIALKIMLLTGTAENRLIIGFMVATALISMWVSNTATTIMMLPIGLSVINMIRDQGSMSKGFPVALLLAIAYGASTGGFATLIGTPPNALLVAFLQEQYDIQVGFAHWLIIGVPASAILLLVTGLWLSKFGYQLKSEENQAIKKSIEDQQQQNGVMSAAEKAVTVIFLFTAVTWILRPKINGLMPSLNLTDASIALIATVILFIWPANWKKQEFLMGWKDMRRMPWDVLLLFGGGLSLASLIRKTGLADWIAGSLNILEGMPTLLAIALVVAIIIFLTEVTSNAATTAAFLPPLGALAISLGMEPATLAIPATIAASCAFMLPVATPPNAIVYGSGMLPIRHMVRSGMVLNLAGIIIITLLAHLLVKYII